MAVPIRQAYHDSPLFSFWRIYARVHSVPWLGNSSALRTSAAGLGCHSLLEFGYDGSCLSIWLPAVDCRTQCIVTATGPSFQAYEFDMSWQLGNDILIIKNKKKGRSQLLHPLEVSRCTTMQLFLLLGSQFDDEQQLPDDHCLSARHALARIEGSSCPFHQPQ